MQIELPYKWAPRDYQRPLWDALMKDDCKRACYVWHRRAGKDLFGLNVLICSAILNTAGTYWHVFPTYNQGKKAIWSESDITGRKYLDYIPKELIKNINKQEMRIEFINGSIYQIVGSDNVDALRGAGIKGAVFSEYAEQRASAWEVIQPMLMATNGWALFNFTPKGQNHAYELWKMAEENENWITSLLTVDDTKGQVFSGEQIKQIKTEFIQRGKPLDLFNQEYYCSFNAAVDGAFYAEQLNLAEEEGRVTNMPWEQNLAVDTWWDLGGANKNNKTRDMTAIWFTQQLGHEVRFIDYIEGRGKTMADWIKIVKEKPYMYNTHNAPHDIAVVEWGGNGKSRLENAASLGVNYRLVPKMPEIDGINAARSLFNKCIFDKDKTKKGVLALRNFKEKYDEKSETFKPYSDWSAHGADAFRYAAIGISETKYQRQEQRPQYYIHN